MIFDITKYFNSNANALKIQLHGLYIHDNIFYDWIHIWFI